MLAIVLGIRCAGVIMGALLGVFGDGCYRYPCTLVLGWAGTYLSALRV